MRPLAATVLALPVIGYLLRIGIGILKLPRIQFHLRRLSLEQVDVQARVGQLEAVLGRLDALSAELPRIAEVASASQTALRTLRRAVDAPAISQPGAPAPTTTPWLHPQIELVPEIQLRRDPPRSLNRLPRLSDWSVGGALSDWMATLREPHVIHRKAWEYAICIEGLQSMGVVHPGARAIAVGAGYERPLFYYANTIDTMVATDLYDNPSHEGQPAMLTEPERFAPFPFRREALDVRRMSGDELNFPDNHFDFAFCLSSIEHFGSRQTQRRALDEMARVVRPGGAVCIITELVLNGEVHPEYFQPAEIQSMFLEHPQLQLEEPAPDLRVSEALLACAIDVRVPADLAASPHIVLTDGRVLWTSLSLFFRCVA